MKNCKHFFTNKSNPKYESKRNLKVVPYKYFTGLFYQGNSYKPKQATVTPNANTTPDYSNQGGARKYPENKNWDQNQGLDAMPLKIVSDETKRTF